jgi:hypothetical protein
MQLRLAGSSRCNTDAVQLAHAGIHFKCIQRHGRAAMEV